MKQIDKRMKLKELQIRLPEKENEFKAFQSQTVLKQKELQQLRNDILDLQSDLTSRKGNIGVSDHAVLRYLERKFNLDIESIRDEILTPTIRDAIKCGVTAVKVGGMSFRVANKTITTVT